MKIEVIEEAKSGRGYFAPYADWEADIISGDPKTTGEWIVRGKRNLSGWEFAYSRFRLSSITAPSGDRLDFEYGKDALPMSISQNGTAFIAIETENSLVVSISINGISTKLEYENRKLTIQPKTPDGWNALAYCKNEVTAAVDDSGLLVTLIYSISKMQLSVLDDQTGRSVIVNNSISGDGNVSNQWVVDIGPIPIGVYTILDHGNNKPGWFELWRQDWWLNDTTTGPRGEERGNFRLHIGTFSAGCITLPKNCEDANTAINIIGSTSTEIIHPMSIYFEEKIKFGTLKVIE